MNRTARFHRAPSSAFTLIELLVVLGLIVALGGITALTSRPAPSAGLMTGGHLVVRIVAGARDLAWASQVPVRLVIGIGSRRGDTAGRWSRIQIYRGEGAEPKRWRAIGPTHQLPDEISIATSASALLSASGAEFGGAEEPGGETVKYLEFAPDGDFQPHTENGDGVLAIATTSEAAGGGRRFIRWRRNGRVTLEEAPVP